jgi:hypothetical protein
MLNRHFYLVLGLLLLVATTKWASAVEESDANQPKPCGGYYACIELQPSQTEPILGQGKVFLTDPGSAQP